MMKFYLSLLLLTVFTGCSKNEDLNFIQDGFYGGFFEYKGVRYYSSIIIKNNRYTEGASGGVIYQKNLPSLTEGTYLVYEGNIIFHPQRYQMDESEIWKRNPDLILKNAFKISFNEKDSFSFSRGTGDQKIVYLLRRYPEKN